MLGKYNDEKREGVFHSSVIRQSFIKQRSGGRDQIATVNGRKDIGAKQGKPGPLAATTARPTPNAWLR